MKLNQLALWLTTVAVTLAAPVSAQSLSPQDSAFVAGVNSKLDKSFQVSDQQKIEAGHSVCMQLKAGQTLGQLIAQDLQSAELQPFNQKQPTWHYYNALKEYAIRNYCPEYSTQLRAWRNS